MKEIKVFTVRIATLVASVALLSIPFHHYAMAQEAKLSITANAPVVLQINGVERNTFPQEAPVGSTVCIAAPISYVGEGDRWVFEKWSTGATTNCVELRNAGAYQAIFSHEVVLNVLSEVSQLRLSEWVKAGIPVSVSVPALVADTDTRYRFQQWTKGETPFLPNNKTTSLVPSEIEAKWVKEYNVSVSGPTNASENFSGWRQEGSSLTLSAPDIVSSSRDGERMKFSRWQSSGPTAAPITDTNSPISTIKVDGPYKINAVYETQYFVVVETPAGNIKKEWVSAGSDIPIEVQPIIEVNPGQERLVFVKWAGAEDLISPKISGTANGPVDLKAVYRREFKVTVVSPYESAGSGWYADGTPATVGVPESVNSKFVFKKTFAGMPGYSGDKSSVTFLVKEPVTVTALYKNSVDLPVLGLLILVPIGIGFLYIMAVRATRRRKFYEEKISEEILR